MESKRKKPWYLRWWFFAIVAFVALILITGDYSEDEADVNTSKVAAESDKPEKSPDELAAEKAELERKAAEAEAKKKADEERWLAESATKEKEDATKEKAESESRKMEIDTSVFEYAKNIEVTDAIDINEHVTLIITENDDAKPGMVTQNIVTQTYDFVQQGDVKGAKTIGINVIQSGNKIAQYTVYTDKFVPNDDEPMSDAVIAASEIEFMTDEVKEFGKTMGSW